MSAVDFADRREQMVTLQLEARGIRDPRVLAAMREIPRHQFVSEDQLELAYDDCALPIGEGQTVSQPYVVAWMLEALELCASDRALEVGAGSGYAAAVLSRLARAVFAVERDPELVQAARGRLAALGVRNVELASGDGSLGWPEHAPFDAILVSAAAARVPPALVEQLAPGGRLVLPVRDERGGQSLLRLRRKPDGALETRELGPVQFVPLVPG
ncbi:MAG TPA: protein-L-isoaspartate(D-aspartate) O-methyltransferase [Myxococcota bacterium]|nr:protein-L-isoaspartate(D-aspartate) O-methyltransferase [Myxococcota bacterium]